MTTRTEVRPWDFSQVLDLVNSLSTNDLSATDWQHDGHVVGSPLYDETPKNAGAGDHIAAKDFGTPSAKLGDFAKIWQYLGTPADSPIPEVPPLTNEPLGADNIPAKIDYTSDGATYFKAAKGGKVVSWQDEASAEEPGTDTVTDRSASPETPTLTKAQRKKQRRRERKAKEATEAIKSATVSESEADTVARRTPARKASAHVVPASVASPRYNLRERDAAGSAIVTPAAPAVPPTVKVEAPKIEAPKAEALQPSVELATSRVAKMLAKIKASSPQTPSKTKPQPATPGNKNVASVKKQTNAASSPTLQRTVSAYDTLHSRPTQQWPVTTSSDAQAMQFVPSTVQPPAHTAARPITTQPSLALSQNTPLTAKSNNIIEPKIVRSGEDRHWALLMKLIGDYWEDRKHLISPMNLTTHNNNPTGIHVFVDASNIFIGFTDQLKRSRGIPQRVQVPPVNLSFDALALLMERRRPIAKRVLVGSTPHLPAFDKAKAVGYECNILEKVMKARELTERQIYFKERDRYARPNGISAKAPPANNVILANSPGPVHATNGHSSNGSGSGSETTATPQYAPARMIEQGVDEILHLKILESIVDTDAPSTIVLATGDAAQAEYSQGFMAMVERALKKGWKVELVSWSKNISMMYSRREWVETWGDRFRVVFLDDYAEELLEM
ncbi:hypothetical protein LTR36_008558 [Oleoguttula mirabilis]|uniref:NYN domain-containing protein n=1 Tax=Oleoguttula mirabilis TaxID=1507867 RepID=A0AAV9JTD0_9PEZI|nr:hypothetical protein LTR36_008558 [Oleoguttula mirabilis]